MKTVFVTQRCFVSILMTCLVIVMMHVTSFDAAPDAGVSVKLEMLSHRVRVALTPIQIRSLLSTLTELDNSCS